MGCRAARESREVKEFESSRNFETNRDDGVVYLQICSRESVRQVEQLICNLQEVFRISQSVCGLLWQALADGLPPGRSVKPPALRGRTTRLVGSAGDAGFDAMLRGSGGTAAVREELCDLRLRSGDDCPDRQCGVLGKDLCFSRRHCRLGQGVVGPVEGAVTLSSPAQTSRLLVNGRFRDFSSTDREQLQPI